MRFTRFKKLYLPTTLSTLVFLSAIGGACILVSNTLNPLYRPSRDLNNAEIDVAEAMKLSVVALNQGDATNLRAGREAMNRASRHLSDLVEGGDNSYTELVKLSDTIRADFDRAIASGRTPTDEALQAIRAGVADLHFRLEQKDQELLLETRNMQHSVFEDLEAYVLVSAIAATALWLLNSFWFIPRYAVRPLVKLLKDQRRLEEDLEREHAELLAIYDTVPVLICVVDDTGTVLYSNPAFATYVDPRHGSCVGMRLGEALGCRNAQNETGGCGFGARCGDCQLRGALRVVLAEGGSGRQDFEHHGILSRDGVPQSVTLLGTAVRLEIAEEARVLLCLQDITARKHTEAALWRSEERMALVLDSATDGWWDWDLVENKLHCSDRWFEMLGHAAGSMAPKPELWQELPHPEDLGRIAGQIQDAMLSDQPYYEIEVRLRHALGHYVPVLSRARILRSADGIPVRICGFNLDLTETKRKEGEYESLVETSMDGFWIVSLQGELLRVNHSICSMLGYTQDELLGMGVSDIDVNESDEDVRYHVAQIVSVGHDIFESRMRRKDGSLVDVEVSGSYPPAAGSRIFAFIRDISQRKAFEASLQASEARFRSYIERAPVGVLVADGSGNYLDANDAAASQLGYTRDEMLALNIRDVLAPESLATGTEHFHQITRGDCGADEVYLRRKDGTLLPTAVHASPLDTDRFLGFHIDISERKKSEAALRHQAALDAVLAEVSQAMIADAYGADIVEPILHHAMHLTGSTVSCLMSPGAKPDTIQIARPGNKTLSLPYFSRGDESADADAAIFEALWAHLGQAETPCTTSVRFVEPLGNNGDQPGEWSVLVLPILQQGAWRGQIVLANAPQGYSATDLSSLGRLGELYRLHLQGMEIKRELESSRQQFLQAQKMEAIGRLAGGVAHDFNNILGVIIGYSEFLLRGSALEGDSKEYLESMRKAALRGADLTRQLLAFARKQAVQPRLLDLNECVGAMLKLLGRLAGEQVNMHWHPVNRPLQIRIDPSQFDQLLANLVVNARDSMDGNGTITIETACEYVEVERCVRYGRECVPGMYAAMSVTDSGYGMDGETLSRVFEPFFTTKPEGQGTGLGLATVHGIVHQNGGFVVVTSEVGHGTTFKIYIPLQEIYTPENSAAVDGVISDPSGTETILLVDDQSDFRDACCRILQCLGYTVIAARNGEQALASLNGDADSIRLLITDLVMPGMNGRELWQQLSVRCPSLRCIYMSGYTADVIGQQGVLDEKICFIEKPFSMSTLARRIREVLDA